MKIPTVDQCRYLGITISTNNPDVDLKCKPIMEKIFQMFYLCKLFLIENVLF